MYRMLFEKLVLFLYIVAMFENLIPWLQVYLGTYIVFSTQTVITKS